MAVVVICGQARKVGKTSVMSGLIAAMPEMRWTAMKITPHLHGSAEQVGVHVETDVENGTDTARYLAAGAVRSLWVRAADLSLAMPRIQAEIDAAENVIIESNSVLEFLKPDVCVGVMDSDVMDVKDSASRHLGRADVMVLIGDRSSYEATQFPVKVIETAPGDYCPAELVQYVRSALSKK